MRGLSAFTVPREWHKLVTLACLLAFVFVAADHAGHHLKIANDATVVTALDAPSGGGDDDDTATDGVCVFCALAAAGLPAMPVITGDPLRVLIEARDRAFIPRHIGAETPPPIF